jgi:hypothetical protein
MDSAITQIYILDRVNVTISPKDLAAALKTKANGTKLLETADKLLTKIQGKWHPRAVFRWLLVTEVSRDTVSLKTIDEGESRRLYLGFAGRFMTRAKYGIVAVFTAGAELEHMTQMASKEKRIMDAYLFDMIGLVVLEKTRQKINEIIEEKAREFNWGVGPFLSPGSVHGWELDDQDNLCSLLPLEKIGVTGGGSGILRPFKTISCMVGIGPEYTSKTVGDTCDVCSKKNQCEMRIRD